MEETRKPKWGLNVPTKRTETPAPNGKPLLAGGKKEEKELADEPDSESYASLPVSEFGAAMLQSMRASSANQRKENKPIQYVPRPVGLGLGASQVNDLTQLKQRKPVELALGLELSPDEQEVLNKSRKRAGALEMLSRHANYVGIDERAPKRIKMVIEVGAKVIIAGGEHADLRGRVVKASSKPAYWLVELAVNREIVSVHQDDLKLAAFSQPSMSAAAKEEKRQEASWLYPGLRVKIVSKNSFHGGKYYNVKGVILDVHGQNECSMRLLSSTGSSSSGSNVLQNVPQWALQTCIPRRADPVRATVRLLKPQSEHFHAPFRVLQLDDHKSEAIIQADDDPSVVLEVNYDEMCEFVEIY